jgi:hypothetical protein
MKKQHLTAVDVGHSHGMSRKASFQVQRSLCAASNTIQTFKVLDNENKHELPNTQIPICLCVNLQDSNSTLIIYPVMMNSAEAQPTPAVMNLYCPLPGI